MVVPKQDPGLSLIVDSVSRQPSFYVVKCSRSRMPFP